jgi:parvulin-like peptidyl-prolyl isomerase
VRFAASGAGRAGSLKMVARLMGNVLPMQRRAYHVLLAILVAAMLLLGACRDDDPPAGDPAAGNDGRDTAETALPDPSVGAAPTVTAIPPTPTPEEPLAARVNGEPITLAAYEEALARQQQGQSVILQDADTGQDQETLVLDMLIERALIEQAAMERNIVITPEMLDQQMAELRQAAEENNGIGSFEGWLQANQWTEEAFRDALAYEMLTERLATLVTADAPLTVPQVRARYIQVDDAALAQSLLDQARNGTDFAALAREHSLDRATALDGGDLGYFAEGTLLVPELEEAAFSMQAGEVSDVIIAGNADGSQTVYYLVQVVDVDLERPLGPDQRAVLLQERFETWLEQQWSQAVIERLIETGT